MVFFENESAKPFEMLFIAIVVNWTDILDLYERPRAIANVVEAWNLQERTR